MEEVLPIAERAGLQRAKDSTRAHSFGIEPRVYAISVSVLVVLGSFALLPMWSQITQVWATDPLRSIGAVFPVVALVGLLARWRQLGWACEGSWWGLPLALLALPMARFVAVSSFHVMVRGDQWTLLHDGAALFLYGVGTTLLFGGWRLLRAALAPLCLLLAINPVPHAFNDFADLPLQRLSAEVARSFAHLIELQPTGEQLRMMFAPNFGMLIVPGCNGVRGSVTLAFLTLFFGYYRRLRWGWLVAATLGALLLGYGLNLLRLCVLVVYYRIGLSVASIQKYGVGVDYAIGCTLFLLATVAIGLAVRALEPQPSKVAPRREKAASIGAHPLLRAGCFLAGCLIFLVPELHSLATMPAAKPAEQDVLRMLPAQVGPYRLVRTHYEHDGYGAVVLGLGEYESAANGSLTFGLWVGSADHRIATSRLVQDVPAAWTGAVDARSRSDAPVHFVDSMYDDGVSRVLDAETTCSKNGCSAQLAGSDRSGFLFVAPAMRDALMPPTTKRLPILLEREWPSSDTMPTATERSQFEHDAQLFTQQLDLQRLVQSLGSLP